MTFFFSTVRPLLHMLPPETAHHLGLWALKHRLLPKAQAVENQALHIDAFGLHFRHPIGLAAGFDKNAICVSGLLGQGFGFVETGTVTPKPQPGNSRPRIFRLKEDRAVINRLGFNNDGLDVFLRNLARGGRSIPGVVGINIGKNKDSTDAVQDYVRGIRAVYPYADYITLNISSPNTQGLRDLQKGEALDAFLSAVIGARNDCAAQHARAVPVLLKVAPDLTRQEKEDIAALVLSHGIQGMIISNTTIARPDGLRSPEQKEQGGLSGAPLLAPSTSVLADFYRLTGGKIPLIGVGGVSSAEHAYMKIRAGATLVQLYTALVYKGFGVVHEIQAGLIGLLRRDGFSHIKQAVGIDVK